VPKCCPPNEALDISINSCHNLKPNESAWTPNVCDDKDCHFEKDFCRKSNGLRCKDRKIKTYVLAEIVMKLEIVSGKLQLKYKSSADRKWKEFKHSYCADMVVQNENLKHNIKKREQIVVICEEDVDDKFSARSLNSSPQFTVNVVILTVVTLVLGIVM